MNECDVNELLAELLQACVFEFIPNIKVANVLKQVNKKLKTTIGISVLFFSLIEIKKSFLNF